MKKLAALLIGLFAAVVMAGSVSSAEAATYPLKKISPAELAVLIETQRPIAVLDVRSLPDFKKAHIPLAESLPMALMGDAIAHTMIPDVNKVIVVYGATEQMSKEAGQLLCDFGYKNVYYLASFGQWVGEVITVVVVK